MGGSKASANDQNIGDRSIDEVFDSIAETREAIADRGSFLEEGESWNMLAREGQIPPDLQR